MAHWIVITDHRREARVLVSGLTGI